MLRKNNHIIEDSEKKVHQADYRLSLNAIVPYHTVGSRVSEESKSSAIEFL